MHPGSARSITHAVVLAATVAGLTVGCGPNHIGPFTPRQRIYDPGPYAQRDPSAQPVEGSLFSDAQGGYLEDTRAVRVGDIVAIRIEESADAQGDSTTNLSRTSSTSAGMNSFLGLVDALKSAGIDPTKLLDITSSSKFSGEGKTSRQGQLSGSITVRVRKEMPNGDLFLEGTKVVLINNEEYHLYVSGLVRRADIAQDNSIPSSRIADAQIEFTGRGDIADQQRKGWLTRLIDALNPL